MRTVIIVSLVLLALFPAHAQRSPFTDAEVRPPDSTGHYRLVISGHFHGSSGNRSGYPAATLLANLDTIAALAPNVLLSTGDLFLDAEADLPRYRKALFQRLPVPLFNAPGNHDAGKAYVLAIVDGRLQRRDVGEGVRWGRQIEIAEGLQPGDVVLKAPIAGLVAGTPVSVTAIR